MAAMFVWRLLNPPTSIELSCSCEVSSCRTDHEHLRQDKPGVYFLKGAYEQVIRLCSSYNSRGSALSLNNQQRELYQQQIKYMGSAGLRGKTRPPSGTGVSFRTAPP